MSRVIKKEEVKQEPDSLYTPKTVQNLLYSYLRLKEYLNEGTAVNSTMVQFTRQKSIKEVIQTQARPLGSTIDSRHPYELGNYAKEKMDGKKKAIKKQEVHVAVIDLEESFCLLSERTRELLLTYYVYELKTLEELAMEKKVSTNAVSSSLRRSVRLLTDKMNKQ